MQEGSGQRPPSRLAGGVGSYWQRRGAMPPRPSVRASVPAEADVAIVGAGLAGLATALSMKDMRPGADVVVLEAETIGFGASGRNGGLVSPLAAPIWLLSARRGNEHGWALTHLHHAAAQFARKLCERIPAADAKPETLRLDAGGLLTGEGLASVARTLDGLAIPHDLGARTARGARRLDVPAHTLDPYALVRGLAAEAHAKGIAIHEGVRVARIEDAQGGARLILARAAGEAAAARAADPHGIVSARRVVVATNAYTAGIALPRQPSAHAVWNYMLASPELDPVRLTAIGREEQFTVEINRAYVFWRRHGNRIVFGGIDRLRHKLGEFDVPDEVMRGLDKLTRASLGGDTLPAEVSWAGCYHATRTELPIIGPAPGLAATVLNVGYGGTGVALTQVLAPVAAAMALGVDCADQDAARLYKTMQATGLPVTAGIKFGAGVAWSAAGAVAGALARRIGLPTRN